MQTNNYTTPLDNVFFKGLKRWRDVMSIGRVLVVDDEADVRKAVRLTLVKAGLDVIEAEDGEKAIKEIRSADNPVMLDAIVCDIQMPKINGLEATAFFRKEFPSVPV